MRRRSRSAVHLVGNVAPMVTGIVTAPLTARALGVSDRGTVAMLLLIGGFLAVGGSLGMGWAARADVARDRQLARAWVGVARAAARTLALPSVLIGLLLSWRFGFGAATAACVVIWLALSAVSASRSIVGNVLVAVGHPHVVGAANLAMSGVTTVAMVALFSVNFLSVASAVAASAAGVLVQWAWLQIGWLKRSSDHLGIDSPNLSLRAAVGRGKSAWLSQVVDAFSARSDSIVFLAAGNHVLYGLYSVVAILPSACAQVYATLVQRSYAHSPELALSERTRRLLVTCLVAGAPLAALGAVVGYFLIPPFFGQEFADARACLLPAAAFSVALAVLGPILADAGIRGGPARFVGLAYLALVVLAAVFARLADPRAAVVLLAVLTLAGVMLYTKRVATSGPSDKTVRSRPSSMHRRWVVR